MPMSISKALPALVLSTLVACHAKAADPPHMTSPSIDIEVDDRGPDRASHLARMSVVLVDGNAKLQTRDGELRYELAAHVEPVRGADGRNKDGESALGLRLVRDQGSQRDLSVDSTIAGKAGGRVLVARVDRADGRTTTVTAQVH